MLVSVKSKWIVRQCTGIGRGPSANLFWIDSMLKRIAVADLRIGMYIQEFCGSWMDHPFWKSKFVLNSDKDLARIRDSAISELWIDVSKGEDVAAGVQAATEAEVECEAQARLLAAIEPPKVKVLSMEQELEQAMKLCARSKQAVMEMFSDARMGQALQFEQAELLVEEISKSVMRHPNALISLARLKHSNEYTYMHSVAVCALMIALARQLGLPEAAVREAGLAGLLHDIGKMAVPQDLLDKPGKLSDSEFAAIRKHPEEGGQHSDRQQAGQRSGARCLSASPRKGRRQRLSASPAGRTDQPAGEDGRGLRRV
jgi:putative nucleotidyltransferase with HDIG domain